MKRYLNVVLGLLLGVSLLSSQGCVLLAGAAAGVGGYAYATGSLAKNLDSSTNEVHDAAIRGLKDIGAFVVTDNSDGKETKIHAESVDGKNIKVDIEPLTDRASKIKIRVGTFGSETESLAILKAITNRL